MSVVTGVFALFMSIFGLYIFQLYGILFGFLRTKADAIFGGTGVASEASLTSTTSVTPYWGLRNEYISDIHYTSGENVDKYRELSCDPADEFADDETAEARDELTSFSFGDPFQVAIDLSQDNSINACSGTATVASVTSSGGDQRTIVLAADSTLWGLSIGDNVIFKNPAGSTLQTVVASEMDAFSSVGSASAASVPADSAGGTIEWGAGCTTTSTRAPVTGNAPNGKTFGDNLGGQLVATIILLVIPLVLGILLCVWWYACAYYCICCPCHYCVFERGPLMASKITRNCYPITIFTCLFIVIVVQIRSFWRGAELRKGINLAYCGMATMHREMMLGEVSTRDGRFVGLIQLSLDAQTIAQHLKPGSTFQTDLSNASGSSTSVDKANQIWKQQLSLTSQMIGNYQADVKLFNDDISTTAAALHWCPGCVLVQQGILAVQIGQGVYVESATIGVTMFREMVQYQLLGSGGAALRNMLISTMKLFKGFMTSMTILDGNWSDDGLQWRDKLAGASSPNYFGAYVALVLLLVTVYVQWLNYYREVRKDTGHYRQNPMLFINWCCGCCCSFYYSLVAFYTGLWVAPAASFCLWLDRLDSHNMKYTANAILETRFDQEAGNVLDTCIAESGDGDFLQALQADGCKVPILNDVGAETGTFAYPLVCEAKYQNQKIPLKEKLVGRITGTFDAAFAAINAAAQHTGTAPTLLTGSAAGLTDLIAMGPHTFTTTSYLGLGTISNSNFMMAMSDGMAETWWVEMIKDFVFLLAGGTLDQLSASDYITQMKKMTDAPTPFSAANPSTKLPIAVAVSDTGVRCEDVDFPTYGGLIQQSRKDVVQGMKTKYQHMYRISDVANVTKIYGWQHLYTSILHYQLPASGGTAYAETTSKMNACGESEEMQAALLRCPDPSTADKENLWPKCRAMLLAAATVQNLASALGADIEGAALFSNLATDFSPLGAWALGLAPLSDGAPGITSDTGDMPYSTSGIRYGATAMCNPCWAGKEVLMQKMRIGSVANVFPKTSLVLTVFPEPATISGEVEIIYTPTSSGTPCQWGLGGSQSGTDFDAWSVDCATSGTPTMQEPSAWSVATRADEFDDYDVDLVSHNVGAFSAAYAAVENSATWTAHADATMDHPLKGNHGLCARLADTTNKFWGISASSQDTSQRMTTLAKACVVSTFMAQGLWNATKRVESVSNAASSAITCTDADCMRTLVNNKIVQPLKDTFANNVNCKLLHTSIKTKVTRGLCLGTMVESGRVGWDARWIGTAFFLYTFASWMLWRRVRDNVKVQHKREKKAMQDLEYMKEMEADGYGALVTEEERSRVMNAVDAVQKHREHMVGAAAGKAWKGIHQLEGVGKDLFTKGISVGSAVVAKGASTAGNAAAGVSDKISKGLSKK